MAQENGAKYDILVVGTNQVPNFKSISETLKIANGKGNITIAEHPYVETHRGMGERKLQENLKNFDAIEGHNSQAVFSSWLTKLPVLGKTFSRAGREANKRAKEFARNHNIPYVATSDAHRIEDLGISYISVDDLDYSNGDKLLESLKEKIRFGDFLSIENYEKLSDWFKWVYTFQKGIKNKNRDDNEKFISSVEFK